ncbi:TraB/GumN family protein [Massilia terrae]|uniref:TraB/GumN family protein n=1 Tax=Massilia terrae TaxID=1811224 RepID=A0ABT2D1C6_9BURK|nr:TraB/GumN family protein [Massilia terrae]MCS0659601.1 TraB/GumN family protein [Massilia terrae]
MARRLIIFVLAAFILLAGPASAVERGALFKVSGHGHTMYLFGTIHMGLPEFFPLDDSVTRALAASTTLALEIDPTVQNTKMAAALQQAALTTPAIVAAMPPALGPRLRSHLEALGAPATLSTKLKPWMLVMTLELIEYAKLGYRPDLGVDAHLAKLAHSQNIKVIALETVKSQIDLFDRLPVADQWTILDEALASLDSGEAQEDVQSVTNGWARADHATLDALALKYETDQRLSSQILQRRLLTARNGPMADKLDGLLKREKNTMAAVGLMHLIGKDSVPALLRAKGLKVEQVY